MSSTSTICKYPIIYLLNPSQAIDVALWQAPKNLTFHTNAETLVAKPLPEVFEHKHTRALLS